MLVAINQRAGPFGFGLPKASSVPLKLLLAIVLALGLTAGTLVPVDDIVPEPVAQATSMVVPDGIEEVLQGYLLRWHGYNSLNPN